MNKWVQFIFVLFLLPLSVLAQNPKRNYVKGEEIPHGYKVTVSDGVYLFYAYSPKIVETTFIPNGQKHPEYSHAVVAPLMDNPFTVGEVSTGSTLLMIKNGITISIDHTPNDPFQISYFYDHKYITSEKWGYDVKDDLECIEFNLEPSELLYGGGARALGMNRRGYRLQLYNRAHYGYETHSELMNYTIPMVLSSKLYALHFDNAPIGYLDLDSKKDNTLSYQTISGRKTYQVIVGDDWKNIVSEYTYLTGRQPMPPRWAFGNFASRFGYHSETEARSVVDLFRKDSIPLDAIIFDLYWFGKEIQGTLGNLEFYKDSFPNPKKMIADFSTQKVKTILITEPFILTTSKRWSEAVENKVLCTDSLNQPFTYNFYFGNTGLIDMYDKAARSWFWSKYMDLSAMGVKGFWGDLGEPEVHPTKLLHANGITADEVHNTYGHDWARLIYEGYKTNLPKERPFILMRSGYSGTQRFGIIPWSGDVNRTWGGLKPQMEISMQMGLQGLAYMHSDLGGFGGANDDPELYVRWLQYGVFQPIFRPHAQQEVASEAIYKDPATKALAKSAIELRYKLLPYNYTLAFENHVQGTPLMRPLFMEDSTAHWSENAADVYMWGDAFLVYPITDPGVKTKQIHFPEHATWFDFSTDQIVSRKRIDSKSSVDNQQSYIRDYPLVLDHIPVFVKAGSFIPMIPNMQNTEEYKAKDVEVHFYYDPSIVASLGSWYDDDGTTSDAFELKQYRLIKFHYSAKNKKSLILVDKEQGKNFPMVDDTFKLIIHNVFRAPRGLKIDGKASLGIYNEKNLTLIITTHAPVSQSKISIVW
jgi:alpha-glucosidase (family GH31 glycosyl hydrolase)